MNRHLYFLTLLLSTQAIGQTINTLDTSKSAELTITNEPTLKDIVGRFRVSNGFAGECYQIDSNNTFKLLYFDCVSRHYVDSGKWVIKGNLIILTSKRRSAEYRIFHCMSFSYLIRTSEIQKFQHDFKTAIQQVKISKTWEIGDRIYSSKELAASSMGFKYLMADSLDDAGT